METGNVAENKYDRLASEKRQEIEVITLLPKIAKN